jgi:hypothetical protein
MLRLRGCRGSGLRGLAAVGCLDAESAGYVALLHSCSLSPRGIRRERVTQQTDNRATQQPDTTRLRDPATDTIHLQ